MKDPGLYESPPKVLGKMLLFPILMYVGGIVSLKGRMPRQRPCGADAQRMLPI